MSAHDVLARYYATFNAGDREALLALLTEDVVHDVNQGGREVGREAFRRFMARMDRSYREQVVDLVTMVGADESRAAAELTVVGTYLATDAGLPEARGQTYRLPVGAFFELRGGLVARVTNHYNLEDWLRQIRA